MYGHVMAAIGAVLLFVFGAGCATPQDLSAAAGSAMARTDDLRAHADGLRVTIQLREIVSP